MTARNSLLSMSMIAFLPGLALAGLGVMGGIGGTTGLQMIAHWIAALIGGGLALLPVLIFAGLFPKTGGKAKPAAAKAAPEKTSKKANADEAASEELDVAGDDEFAEASDDFSAVSDDELEFGDVDEFDEEEEEK